MTISRYAATATGILGRLTVGNLQLHTIERADNFVPEGIYSGTLAAYKRHSYLAPMLKNVTDRSPAFIQTGTYAADSDGNSFIVGTSAGTDSDLAGTPRNLVINSLDALDQLLEALGASALYDDGTICRAKPLPHNCKTSRMTLAGDGTLEDYQSRAFLIVHVQKAADFADKTRASSAGFKLSRGSRPQPQPQAVTKNALHVEFACPAGKALSIISERGGATFRNWLAATAGTGVTASRFQLHYSDLRATGGGFFVLSVTSVAAGGAKSDAAIVNNLLASGKTLRAAMNVTSVSILRVCGPCGNAQQCNTQTLGCDAIATRTWKSSCNLLTETCPSTDVDIWVAPKEKDPTRFEISFTTASWHSNQDTIELLEWRDCDTDRSCTTRAKSLATVAVPSGAAGLMDVEKRSGFCMLWVYRDYRGNILERLGRWGPLCCDGKRYMRKCYGGACLTAPGPACSKEDCSRLTKWASDLIIDDIIIESNGDVNNLNITVLGDLNDPENPNSPLNPSNPNFDPTISADDDDLGDLNDPTNPKSPLNKDNPKSPLNPNNPNSPLNPNHPRQSTNMSAAARLTTANVLALLVSLLVLKEVA